MINITDVIYYSDMSGTSECCGALLQEELIMRKFFDIEYVISVSKRSGKNYMLFTIPYEDGWKRIAEKRRSLWG